MPANANYNKMMTLDPISYPVGSARKIQCSRRPIIYTPDEIKNDPNLLHGQGDSYLVYSGNYYLVPSDKIGACKVGLKTWFKDGETILSPALYTITSRCYRGDPEV